MTAIDPSQKPLRIELQSDRIFVRYGDASVAMDTDVASENGVHRVDVFMSPSGPDAALAIATDERYRADAARWGSVRDRLASREETSAAQGRFMQANVFAHGLLAEFTDALQDKAARIVMKRVGGHSELFYLDPEGDTHPMRLEIDPKRPGRVTGLEIEDEDGMVVVIRDPALLNPLKSRLEGWLGRQNAANRR